MERELGAGGMATVYLAHDLKHEREVAIKVLHPDLGAALGSERFLAEIKTTARLQHPHILPLLDSGDAGNGLLYYVMPFVRGETLRARLERERQLPVEDAVRIAREVASALDHAHREGVVHRDIKPENILLQYGNALVADFGIALAVQSAGGARMTQTGLSLGTPQYMSPEQAMGERTLDARSDVYALGAVTYEMLCDEPPFTGPTVQATVAKVLAERPTPPSLVRDTVPPGVEAAVLRALAKLPADRFPSATAFGDALSRGETPAGRLDHATSSARASAPASRFGDPLFLGAVAVSIGLAVLASIGWQRSRTMSPPPEVRFTIEQRDGAAAFGDAPGSPLALSPDGTQLVYVGRDAQGRQHLFRRSLRDPEPELLAGTLGASAPFLSPDGLQIGFLQEERIRSRPLAGGPVTTISERGSYQVTWGADGAVWITRERVLERIPPGAGAPEIVHALDSTASQVLRWPDPLPGGRGVLLTLLDGTVPRLALLDLTERTLKPLGPQGMYARWVNGGFLVWLDRDGTLYADRFDEKAGRLAGAPTALAANVRYGPTFPGKLAISRTGTVAYFEGTTETELLLVDPAAGTEAVLLRSGYMTAPRFSPDGTRIAYSLSTYSGRSVGDVWLVELATGTTTRVTFDTRSFFPEWLTDGRRLLVPQEGPPRIVPVDGNGDADTLRVDWGDAPVLEVQLLPDGRRAVYRRGIGSGDILAVRLGGSGGREPLQVTPFHERSLAVSRDGERLAYVSNESGEDAVYVRSLTGAGGRLRASPAGGTEPRWGAAGRDLYYRSGDSIYRVEITPGETDRVGPPRAVWGGRASRDAHAPTGTCRGTVVASSCCAARQRTCFAFR